jgi:hypothetical protein
MERKSPPLVRKLGSKTEELYPQTKELSHNEMWDTINNLRQENLVLKDLIRSYGIDCESVKLSDTEMICLKQLNDLHIVSQERPLNKDEVTSLDLLHRNLLVARNIPILKKSKKDKKTPQELMEIVKNSIPDQDE